MTLKNNRAPLLSNIKLYASFYHHMWIQTGVTVRKRLSWVVTSVTLTFDLWSWPFAWTLLWSLLITPENFMMIRWWEHSQKGVTDRQTDGQTDGQTENTICRAAWSQLKTVKPASQISGEILNSYRFIATWSVQQLLASLCRQPAPVCPAIDEIRYNSTGNPWQSERLLEMHQNQANVFKSIRASTEFPKWNSSTLPGLFKHLNGKIQALPCIDFIVPAFNWDQILAGTRIF